MKQEFLSDGSIRQTDGCGCIVRKNEKLGTITHVGKNGSILVDNKYTGLRYYKDQHGVVKVVNLNLGSEERGKMKEMFKSGTELVMA